MKATSFRFFRGGKARNLAIAILAVFTLSVVGAAANAGDFWYVPLSNDDDCGVSANKTYTHAYNLGGSYASNATVNGVDFTAITSTNPSSLNLTTSGFSSMHGAAGNVTGSISNVVNSFVYGLTTDTTQAVTLTGLEVGQSYTTTFYNYSWGAPVAEVLDEITGDPTGELTGGRVVTINTSDGTEYVFDENFNGTATGYYGNMLHYSYTATDPSMTFTMTPHDPGNTYHFYGFSNELINDAFNVANYTGDADCGISSEKNYSHAYRIGSTANLDINGVTFTGANGAAINPSVSDTDADFSTSGFTSFYGGLGDNANISGAIDQMTRDFCYSNVADEADQVLTLEDLVPGTEYELAIYSMSWSENRLLNVSTSLGDMFMYDQNFNGNGANGNGIGNVLTYSYIATDETMSISFSPINGSTDGFHFYGFSNEIIAAATVPEPSTTILLLGAFAALVAIRRKK